MFHFTIRDVLWLTALVGIGAGWWADRNELDIERDGWKRAYIMYIHDTGHVSFDVDDPGTLEWLKDGKAEARVDRLKASLTK